MIALIPAFFLAIYKLLPKQVAIKTCSLDFSCRKVTRFVSVTVFLVHAGGLCIVCLVFLVEIQEVINIFQKVDTFT